MRKNELVLLSLVATYGLACREAAIVGNANGEDVSLWHDGAVKAHEAACEAAQRRCDDVWSEIEKRVMKEGVS